MIPHCLAILLVLQKASTTTSGQPPPAASECTGCSAKSNSNRRRQSRQHTEGEPHGACGGQIAVALSLAGAEMFTLPKRQQSRTRRTASARRCSCSPRERSGRRHQGDAGATSSDAAGIGCADAPDAGCGISEIYSSDLPDWGNEWMWLWLVLNSGGGLPSRLGYDGVLAVRGLLSLRACAPTLIDPTRPVERLGMGVWWAG